MFLSDCECVCGLFLTASGGKQLSLAFTSHHLFASIGYLTTLQIMALIGKKTRVNKALCFLQEQILPLVD